MSDPNRHALERFGKERTRTVHKLTKKHGGPFSTRLILAIGLRETWLQNIVGDYGHGRGVFQQDDRFQAEFLRKHKGCKSGTYRPVYPNAYEPGRVPTLRAGVHRCLVILKANYAYGQANGVRQDDLVRFAVAAYNAGPGGAFAGYRIGDVDHNTAGGNYSKDVLSRKPVCAQWLKQAL